jgi:hypothetical protein
VWLTVIDLLNITDLDNVNALEVKHANLPRQKQFKALAAYTDEQEGADVMKVRYFPWKRYHWL